MYTEDELLPLSALAQYAYCERRCALIHVERLWAENLFTAEGRIGHERVHEEHHESRGDLRVEFSLPLRSLVLGLVGVADVVEFHLDASTGAWKPFPVEHKRGRPKVLDCDRVQLCGQALCMEEMLGLEIPSGAIFYGKTRRRELVDFSDGLRAATIGISVKVRELLGSGEIPAAEYSARCDGCSLLDLCLPKACGRGKSVSRYLATVWNNT